MPMYAERITMANPSQRPLQRIGRNVALWLAVAVLTACNYVGQNAAPNDVSGGWAPDGDPLLYPNVNDVASLPKSGDCNIEFLNGKPLDHDALRIDRFVNYAISGWVIDAVNHDTGNSLQLVVTELHGSNGWVMKSFQRIARPDVVQFRDGDSAYMQSGFMALFPSDELKPGKYRIALVYGEPDARRVCSSQPVFEVTG